MKFNYDELRIIKNIERIIINGVENKTFHTCSLDFKEGNMYLVVSNQIYNTFQYKQFLSITNDCINQENTIYDIQLDVTEMNIDSEKQTIQVNCRAEYVFTDYTLNLHSEEVPEFVLRFKILSIY